ncbi:MAG TPA: hypothetical protein VKN36_08560, partial [Eudoraea sp.]|nr:hypothetical protein [Eudoraea sp.]
AKDATEIASWTSALNRAGRDFPFINSFKSTMGHCLAAAGSLECVATLLQFREGRFFGNINCEDLHPEIAKLVDPSRIPLKSFDYAPKILAKANFGFGDVNACVIFRAYPD